MRGLVLRFLINAVAIAVITSGILPGIRIVGENTTTTLVVVALVFGVINALVKPIVSLLTCPFIVFTLGLFVFIINGLMLYLTAALSESLVSVARGQLYIEHFGWAVLGALIISVISMILESILDVDAKRTKKVTEVRYVVEKPKRSGDDPFELYDPDSGKPKRG